MASADRRTTLELRGERAIVITRTFQAPPRIVFDAWTRAELVARWWAPLSLGVSLLSCDADVRLGGRYRYVMRLRSGGAMAFSGEYREVAPHSRLVYTEHYEPSAGGVPPDDIPGVITVTFEDLAGRTRLVSVSESPSREVRDAIIASGMEQGMRETLDQLDALVAGIAAGGAAAGSRGEE